VPELQVPLGPYRVDLLFRERRLVVEADGLDKYTAAELRREKQREMRLWAMGFHVERALWEDIVRYSPETHARLTAAFRLPA
jgi:very-short-patch-repair endonuclease